MSQRRFQPQFGKRKYILFSVTQKMLRFCFNLPKTDFGRKIKHKSEVERDAETDSYKHHETLFAGSARLKSRVKALLGQFWGKFSDVFSTVDGSVTANFCNQTLKVKVACN